MYPVLLYGLESLSLFQYQLKSLNFVVNRFLWSCLKQVIFVWFLNAKNCSVLICLACSLLAARGKSFIKRSREHCEDMTIKIFKLTAVRYIRFENEKKIKHPIIGARVGLCVILPNFVASAWMVADKWLLQSVILNF